MWHGGRGIDEGGRKRDFIINFWGMEEMDLECRGEEWKKIMYFVCHFNGRWLKDSSFIYCFHVLLNVEGKVVFVIKKKMFPLARYSTFLLG